MTRCGKLPFLFLEIDRNLKGFKRSPEGVFKGGPRESNEPLKEKEARTLLPRMDRYASMPWMNWVEFGRHPDTAIGMRNDHDLNVSDVAHAILTTHAIRIFDCT